VKKPYAERSPVRPKGARLLQRTFGGTIEIRTSLFMP
jgi:hypothetical protein